MILHPRDAKEVTIPEKAKKKYSARAGTPTRG